VVVVVAAAELELKLDLVWFELEFELECGRVVAAADVFSAGCARRWLTKLVTKECT